MANGSRKPADRRVRAAVQKLEDLQRAGITHLPKARRSTRSGGAASPAVAPAAAANTAPAAPPASLPVVDQPVADSAESRAVRLAQLAARVAKCTRCAELARTRPQTASAGALRQAGVHGRAPEPTKIGRQNRSWARPDRVHRDHRQRHETVASGGVHPQHDQVPAAGNAPFEKATGSISISNWPSSSRTSVVQRWRRKSAGHGGDDRLAVRTRPTPGHQGRLHYHPALTSATSARADVWEDVKPDVGNGTESNGSED